MTSNSIEGRTTQRTRRDLTTLRRRNQMNQPRVSDRPSHVQTLIVKQQRRLLRRELAKMAHAVYRQRWGRLSKERRVKVLTECCKERSFRESLKRNVLGKERQKQ